MNILFGIGGFEILFFLMFGLFLVVFVVTLLRGMGEWHRNNQSPRLTVQAAVVAKRQYTAHHTTGNGAAGSSTSYYVTFQVESGDRFELELAGRDYGVLAEGDQGRLTFQGTRFLGFERVW